MQWITENGRIVGAVLSVVSWLIWKTGPAVFRKTKTVSAVAWPKVKANSGSLGSVLLPIIAALVFLFFPAAKPPGQVDPPRVPDIADKCLASERVLVADALRSFAGQKFDTEQLREDAVNEKLLDCYEASRAPMYNAVSAAFKSNSVADVADQIEKGELR